MQNHTKNIQNIPDKKITKPISVKHSKTLKVLQRKYVQ